LSLCIITSKSFYVVISEVVVAEDVIGACLRTDFVVVATAFAPVVARFALYGSAIYQDLRQRHKIGRC